MSLSEWESSANNNNDDATNSVCCFMGFLSEPLLAAALTDDFQDQFLHNLISDHVNGFTPAFHRENNHAAALKSRALSRAGAHHE